MSDTEIKYCPFLRDDCRREQCMLYDKNEISHLGEKGNCAVFLISKEIRNLVHSQDSTKRII